MYTKLSTVEELKGIFIELMLNHTDKVTKVAPGSVLNGIAYGIAKLGQKTIKDIALIESHIFPDQAYGQYLNNIAKNYGVANRFGSSESSTYLRVVADPGTQYISGTHTFSGNHGIVFDLEENVTVGDDGFAYVKVRSQTTGETTNVDALTINKIIPLLSGHKYVINENRATGGRDTEDDDTFRNRIKEGANILARGTIAMIEQAFMLINSNVMKVYYNGIN
jgi:uncharacterized phage protein gp47/JayE